MPYGFSRCEVRIDSADGFPNDDGYLFAVERSDPQRVLFIHATADARSPRYFGDALGSGAESAFVLQPVSVEQAVNLPLSKYGFVVLSNLFGLPAPLETGLLEYVKGGGSVLLALGTSRPPRPRADLRRARARFCANHPAVAISFCGAKPSVTFGGRRQPGRTSSTTVDVARRCRLSPG